MIARTCACGRVIPAATESKADRRHCSHCGAPIPPFSQPRQAGVAEDLDPAFIRDRFLLRQKHLAIGEKYLVWDEDGQPILFVHRPAHFRRSLLVILIFLVALVAVLAVAFLVLRYIQNPTAFAIGMVIGLLAAVLSATAAALAAAPKRHVGFYRDDSGAEKLLDVFQEQKVALINARYTVATPAGEVIGRLTKNYLYDILRKRWYVHGPDGELIAVAKEDSILRSILRRALGHAIGMLRTNFIIVDGLDRDARILGKFDRQFTLLDRYVLDLQNDLDERLDRRLAVALGVMLDSGERR